MNSLDPIFAIENKLAAIQTWRAEWQRAQRELSPEVLAQRGVQNTSELEQKRRDVAALNERILQSEKVLTERLEMIRKIDNIAVQTNLYLPTAIQEIEGLLFSNRHLISADIRKRSEQTKTRIWEQEIAKIAERYREDPRGWEAEIIRLPQNYGTPPDAVTPIIEEQRFRAQKRTAEWEATKQWQKEEEARPRTPKDRFRLDYNMYKQYGDRDETLVAGLAAYAMGDKDPSLQERLLQNKYVLAKLLPPELLQPDDKTDPIPPRGLVLWVVVAGLLFFVVGSLGGWFYRNYQCGSEDPAADCVAQAVIITRTPAPIAGIVEPMSTTMAVASPVPTATLAEPTPVTPTEAPIIKETVLIPTDVPEPTATSTERPTETPTETPMPPIQLLVEELRPMQEDITDTISIEGIDVVAPLLEPLNVAYLSQYPGINNPVNTGATLVIPDTATNPELNLTESFMAMSRLCATNSDLDALLLTETPDPRILQLCSSTGTPMEAISFATFTPAGEQDSRIVYLVTPESAFHTKPELLGYLLNWYTLPDEDVPSGFAKLSEEEQVTALEKFKVRKNQIPNEIASEACTAPALEVVAVPDPLFPDGKQYKDNFIPGGPYSPQQPLTISWKLQNTGDCPWVKGSYVKITGNVTGIQLPTINTDMKFPISPTDVGEETVFFLSLLAPQPLGFYDAKFTLYTLVDNEETVVGDFATIGNALQVK